MMLKEAGTLHPEKVMEVKWSAPQGQAVTELQTEHVACVSRNLCFKGSERVLLMEIK